MKKADICLILEGTYPYVVGGVSTWAHELISYHKEYTFALLCIVPPLDKPLLRYHIPPNVVSHDTFYLQYLKKGALFSSLSKTMSSSFEEPLYQYINGDFSPYFDEMLDFFIKHQRVLGRHTLVESKVMWEMALRLYNRLFREGSFLDFFWSLVTMSRSLYSLLLPKLPQARLYHALSTGYAGLMLARAKKETQMPCFLTEHGLYTIERRIEISTADWFGKPDSLNLSFDYRKKTLANYWMQAFLNSGTLSYKACDVGISLFEANKELQVSQGADRNKLRVIPNGIDITKFESVIEKEPNRPPTVAFIGRIVPIKDVITFIRGMALLHKKLPNLKVFLLGPGEEDPLYFQKCQNLVLRLKLEKHLFFMGNVVLEKYLKKVDIIVLTSVSESQPLTILECGAAKIPCVATNVGSCQDLIYGKPDESPPLGPGGEIVSLANSDEVANACYHLLTDKARYEKAANAIYNRVKTYYTIDQQHAAYQELYKEFLK